MSKINKKEASYFLSCPSQKTNIEGGLPKKVGAWTVCRFKGGLGKKEGMVFLRGGWYPDAHYGFALLL